MTSQDLVTIIMEEFRSFAEDSLNIKPSVFTYGSEWKSDESHWQRHDEYLREKMTLQNRLEAAINAYVATLGQRPADLSRPVFDAPEVLEGRERMHSRVAEELAAFDWNSLNSTDYATARRAYYVLDWLKLGCAPFEDLRSRFSDAANKAGVRVCVVR